MERKFKLRNGTIVVLDQSEYSGGVRVVESVGETGWEKDAHGCLLLCDDDRGGDGAPAHPLAMTGGAWGSEFDVVAEVKEMTPAEQIAWHRSEADRIEAEERARRPALAAGQVWRYVEGPETNRFWCILVHVRGELLAVSDRGAVLYDFLNGIPKGFELVGSLARDVLRVVPPKLEEERNLLLELESLYRGTSRESREMNAVLRKLDAVHNPSIVVPPDPPAPQVAPEPTGAELVGKMCWVRDAENEAWRGPYQIGIYLRGFNYPYRGEVSWWGEAKLYVEGVAP